MSTLATWDNITGALGSTNTTFGGQWGNLISDFFNGINLALSDPTKVPRINTLTRFKHQKLGLFDGDESHDVLFSVDDIDTGPTRKIKIRRMNTPFEEDYMLFEGLPAAILNKTIDFDLNTGSNISNSHIKTGAGITYAKLNLSNSILNADINTSAAITDSKLAQITDKAKLPSDAVYTTGSQTITGKTFNSLNNVFANVGSFRYQIFKSGANYYCRDNLSGVAVAFGTDPVPVLRYPLLNGGDAYIHGADYIMPTGYVTYFDFPVETLYCYYHMAPDARIMVPQGFTGTAFRFKNTTIAHCTGNKLIGGIIRESGTVERNWTAILFECTGGEVASKGVFSNKVQFTSIWDALNGVRFNADATATTGFNTSNYCENLFIYRCKADFVGYNMDVAYTTSPNVNGSHRNRFNNCLLQSSGLTTEENCVAVNNVMGRENTFTGVYAADFNGKNKTCIIHADSDSTIIEGGSLTVPTNTTHDPVQPRFEDNSTLQNTKIRDMYRHNQIGRITPGINGNAMEIVPWTGQTTNTFSWWDASKFERLIIQKTSTDYKFDINRSNASGALRPVLFRMVDSVGGGAGTIESFRIEPDGSLRVAPGKLKFRDSNDTHDITITVPNNAANYNLAIPTLTANDTIVTVGTAGAASVATLDDIGDVTLTSVAAYDIPYRNAGNTAWENLPKGTNNRSLTINSSGVLGWNFITNANMLAHTSTQITITAKGQLNNQIGYKDETAWLTESMIETNLLQLIKGPIRGKKFGGYTGTSATTGFGMIGTLTGIGNNASTSMDNDYGTYYARPTNTAAGDAAGLSYSQRLTMRKFNPLLAMLYRPSHVSLNRMYLGWKSTAASPAALTDDPLSNLSGVMFLQRSGDTTWRICSNDGTNATSTIVDTTTTISSTIPTHLQIRAVNASSKWQWSTDGGQTWTDVTGLFPAETTNLFYVAELQTNEPGVAHSIHQFGFEIVTDK